jgi:serine/threonine protein kinase
MSAPDVSSPIAPPQNQPTEAIQPHAVAQPTGIGSTRLASLQIRCPVCREPFSVAADQPLHDLHCTHCQRKFCLADDDSQPAASAKIGHFELLHCLGMGGFGTVWKARDIELDRVVAIKIPRQGRLSPAEMEEFVYEARVAAQLRHPHIVPVYEIGREGDDVFIVSELIDGSSLSDFARRMTPAEAAELCATVADALHFAHAAGVVHRDLKPGNILIDKRGAPHITDFGLAIRANEEVALTVDGAILGTPAYMSPEQARGDM